MTTYSRLADLPLEVEGHTLAGLERAVSSGFTRATTIVRLYGAGEEGVGEDVTYDAGEQKLFQVSESPHDLAGSYSLDSFSKLAGSLDLFPAGDPTTPAWRLYRRWALESAALDLALRQAGRSLADLLGRECAPVRFVVSTRLGERASSEPLLRILERYPGTRFKLDPTSDWDDRLVAELAGLGAVDTIDLKGAYRGTVVDQPADPALYRRVAEGFEDAWIEDPDLTLPETDEVLAPHRDRVTWDAIIHGIADIEALPFPPRMLNFKPSRFGSLESLLDAYDFCAERGIGIYGGGQFELGPGRGQIQYLASLFHPHAPNDVAPPGYNEPEPPDGLPASPLPRAARPIGFRWQVT